MKNNWYKIAQSSSQYTVKEGDTLSIIAKNLLGDEKLWTEIHKINPQIKDPAKIIAGSLINIPIITKKEEHPKYTIKSGDTLASIAKSLLGNANLWKEIHKINPQIKDPSKVDVGTVINIPHGSDPEKIVTKEVKEQKEDAANTAGISGIQMLKSEISKGEGDYNSYNTGKAGDTPRPTITITSFTVGQIMKMQEEGKVFAVGKYQFIPVTLREAVNNKKVGVKQSDLFSPQTQEKLFMHLIYKRPKLMSYLNGKSNDINSAVNDLAAEFASMPNTSGSGNYDNDKAKNKARGGLKRVERIKEILRILRKEMSEK